MYSEIIRPRQSRCESSITSLQYTSKADHFPLTLNTDSWHQVGDQIINISNVRDTNVPAVNYTRPPHTFGLYIDAAKRLSKQFPHKTRTYPHRRRPPEQRRHRTCAGRRSWRAAVCSFGFLFRLEFHGLRPRCPKARQFNLTIIRSARQIGFAAAGEAPDFYYNSHHLETIIVNV